jgi:hypothetical protein
MLASITDWDDAEQKRKRGSQRTAHAGTFLWYSKFSEFGTVRQSPKSWARPAADEAWPAALAVVRDEFSRGIEREAARLSKATFGMASKKG